MQKTYESTVCSVAKAGHCLTAVRALVAPDMQEVSTFIHRELYSNVPLTQDITDHIFASKGKQLRPLLVVLSARACEPTLPLIEKHIAIAVIIEFVHTATLLHDDVVDHSSLRRGRRTTNDIWGNAASVLVGDFLYSRAFQILSRYPNTRIMQVLSETTNAIAEGEVRQLMNQRDAHLTEAKYFAVITQKTAQLFSAAAEMGAILQGCEESVQQAMAIYGLHLGLAFQIIDDVLDYDAAVDVTGKNVGDDLSEGKATLPLIYAMTLTTPEKAIKLREAIVAGDLSALPFILTVLKETNALEKSRAKAREHQAIAAAALEKLPPSTYREALLSLLLFAVARDN